MKVGTMAAGYYEVHGDYYTRRKGARRATALIEPPEIGARISWQEIENGPWHTGIVDKIESAIDLYFVARH